MACTMSAAGARVELMHRIEMPVESFYRLVAIEMLHLPSGDPSYIQSAASNLAPEIGARPRTGVDAEGRTLGPRYRYYSGIGGRDSQ